jgi:uncharacterized protein
MLGWFQILMPQEERFFDHFNRHAAIIAEGADALEAMLSGRLAVLDGCRKVMDFENDADAVTREVLKLTRRSFITPFDRADIKDLILTLDDSIDQMKKTCKAISLFEVASFEPQMAAISEVIVETAKHTVEAVALLGDLRKQAARVNAVTETIIKLEESADEIHNQGIKALFLKHRGGNAMEYIVGAEIFDHLEKVMDRFEDVANSISAIVIELG